MNFFRYEFGWSTANDTTVEAYQTQSRIPSAVGRPREFAQQETFLVKYLCGKRVCDQLLYCKKWCFIVVNVWFLRVIHVDLKTMMDLDIVWKFKKVFIALDFFRRWVANCFLKVREEVEDVEVIVFFVERLDHFWRINVWMEHVWGRVDFWLLMIIRSF